MQSCPLSLRIEVLVYVPLPDLYKSVYPLCRLLYATLRSLECVKELLKVHIQLQLPTKMTYEELLEVLRSNAPGLKPSGRLLPITGWGITGGDDELIQNTWKPALLFTKDSQGYSSGSSSNLICAGFLNQINPDLHTEIASKAHNANTLLPCPRIDLVQELPVQGLPQTEPRYLACVHQVYISRRGIFSCPLRTFLLLTSLQKIPLHSLDFETYFDLTSSQSVFDRFRSIVSHHHSTSHKYESIHFHPAPSSLQPVLWGQFHTKRCTTIKERLHSRYLGRYFYLLLVNSDDRMREFGDFHSQPNIDLHTVQLSGRVIRLY